MLSRIVGTTMIQINAMTQLSKYEKNYRKQEEKQENSLHEYSVPACPEIKRLDPRGVLNKISYWKAPPRGTTPYPFIYHFWQKMYPFWMPSIDKMTPLNEHTSFERWISFNCFIKCYWGYCRHRKSRILKNALAKLTGWSQLKIPGGTPCNVHADAGPGVAGFLAQRKGKLRYITVKENHQRRYQLKHFLSTPKNLVPFKYFRRLHGDKRCSF